MGKKRNPEQETEPTAEEQVESPVEEPTEEPQDQETPADEPEEETEGQVEETEDQPEQSEDPEDEQEQPPEDQQDTPVAEGGDESAALRRDLLQAQGQLAAYRVGVAPDMIADAVTLAMAEASQTGEVTEATVTKAMEAVLKRHPEWKATEGGKSKGGFKLGADRDNGATFKKPANNTNTKRWNRFK